MSMLAISVAAIAGTAWTAALVVVVRAVLLWMSAQMQSAPVMDEGWTHRLAALETTVAGLPSLWEEERARAERAKERARAHERRAAEILESLQEEEEEGDDVRRFDAPGSDEQRVLPLRPDMGRAAERPEHLARAEALGLNPFALAGM